MLGILIFIILVQKVLIFVGIVKKELLIFLDERKRFFQIEYMRFFQKEHMKKKIEEKNLKMKF